MKRILLYIACIFASLTAWAEKQYSVILPVPVNVYENAIVDAKVIGTLAPKQNVEVYVVNGDWAIIKYNGGVGYVAAACLKEVEEQAQAAQQTAQPKQEQAQPKQEAAQPKQEQAQPKQEQPKQQPAQPKQEQPKQQAAQPKVEQPKQEQVVLHQSPLAEPFQSYTLLSSDDPTADILDCRFNMYLTFGYQMSLLKDYNLGGRADLPLHGGQFEFGLVFKLWGPIGLDFNFGLDMAGRSYPEEMLGSYDKMEHLRLDMSMALRPVFGINLDTYWDLQLYTGPRFTLNFMDYQRSYRNEKDYDDVTYCDLFEKDNSLYQAFTIPWGLGVGFNYKGIGMRVCYEWELYNRYRKVYKDMGDLRYNYLTVSLYIPIHL